MPGHKKFRKRENELCLYILLYLSLLASATWWSPKSTIPTTTTLFSAITMPPGGDRDRKKSSRGGANLEITNCHIPPFIYHSHQGCTDSNWSADKTVRGSLTSILFVHEHSFPIALKSPNGKLDLITYDSKFMTHIYDSSVTHTRLTNAVSFSSIPDLVYYLNNCK